MQTVSALDILLVDDDGPLREMLRRSFEREGHRVTAVADGEAALAAAAERPYDIVLLDVALGAGPTGHDVARMLRSRRDVVPIIMLTALDSEADAVQGLESGADDYVTKPFGLAELRSRIRAVLRRAQGRVVEGSLHVGPAPRATSSRTMSNGRSAAASSAAWPSATAVTLWPSRSNDRDSISRSGSSSSTSRISSAAVVSTQGRVPPRLRPVSGH